MRYYPILLVLFLLACKGENPKATQEAPLTKSETKTNVSSKGFPSLPQEVLMNVWDNGQMIDYIFHNLPFSMNQTELNSIRTNLTYIDPKPVSVMPTACKKPFARQFYQVDGDIVLESDVYFSEGCQLYIFIQNGEEKYGNFMADSGINFFNQMVKKAMEARENAGQ